MFLFIFIIIHAVGNLHVFLGPDDFNGYGYFYVRLYWTGFGLQANIVEASRVSAWIGRAKPGIPGPFLTKGAKEPNCPHPQKKNCSVISNL